MIQFDEHIFQMGWFNHQLGIVFVGHKWFFFGKKWSNILGIVYFFWATFFLSKRMFFLLEDWFGEAEHGSFIFLKVGWLCRILILSGRTGWEDFFSQTFGYQVIQSDLFGMVK